MTPNQFKKILWTNKSLEMVRTFLDVKDGKAVYLALTSTIRPRPIAWTD